MPNAERFLTLNDFKETFGTKNFQSSTILRLKGDVLTTEILDKIKRSSTHLTTVCLRFERIEQLCDLDLFQVLSKFREIRLNDAQLAKKFLIEAILNCSNKLQLANSSQTNKLNQICIQAQIVKLNLSKNYLNEIPIDAFNSSCLPNLVHLDLSNNSLPHELIEFPRFRQLEVLKLAGTGLKRIGPNTFCNEKLPNLRELDLSNNELVDEVFEAIENAGKTLQSLDLSSNQIELVNVASLQKMISLTSLNLNENIIAETALPKFKELVKLERLNVSSNNISCLTSSSDVSYLEGPCGLVDLDLSQNRISGKLSKSTFAKMTSLAKLDVKGNEIEEIENETFSKSVCKTLRILDLSSNKIGFRRKENNQFDDEISMRELESLSSLEKLNLSNNRIRAIRRDFFKPLSKLVELVLSQNELDDNVYSQLKCLTSLKVLNMASNRLQRVLASDLAVFSQLERLHLENNQIASRIVARTCFQSGTFSESPQLKCLHLNNNKIEEIEAKAFENNTNLQLLDLSENQLGDLNRLSENRESLDLASLLANKTQLEILRVAKNGLKRIPPDAFKSLTRLEILDLSHNRLTGRVYECFQTSLPQLVQLNLSHNEFTHIDGEIRHGHEIAQLVELDLSANNLSEIRLGDLVKLKKLDKLNVSKNRRLSSITKGAFKSLIDLSELDLSHNQLTDSVLVSSGFSGLKNNKVATVSSTSSFKNLFADLQSLKVLNLSHNRFDRLDSRALMVARGLRHLDLSCNKLNNTSISLLMTPLTTSLVRVNLSGVGGVLTDLSVLGHLRQCRELDLSSTKLSQQYVRKLKESIKPMEQLEQLRLDANEIERLETLLEHASSLRLLSLSKNSIRSVGDCNFATLNRLERLDLSHNEIETVDAGAFASQADSLLELNLNANKLRHLDLDALLGNRLNAARQQTTIGRVVKRISEDKIFKQLRKLSIAHNLISEVDMDAFKRRTPRLRHFDMRSDYSSSFVMMSDEALFKELFVVRRRRQNKFKWASRANYSLQPSEKFDNYVHAWLLSRHVLNVHSVVRFREHSLRLFNIILLDRNDDDDDDDDDKSNFTPLDFMLAVRNIGNKQLLRLAERVRRLLRPREGAVDDDDDDDEIGDASRQPQTTTNRRMVENEAFCVRNSASVFELCKRNNDTLWETLLAIDYDQSGDSNCLLFIDLSRLCQAAATHANIPKFSALFVYTMRVSNNQLVAFSLVKFFFRLFEYELRRSRHEPGRGDDVMEQVRELVFKYDFDFNSAESLELVFDLQWWTFVDCLLDFMLVAKGDKRSNNFFFNLFEFDQPLANSKISNTNNQSQPTTTATRSGPVSWLVRQVDEMRPLLSTHSDRPIDWDHVESGLWVGHPPTNDAGHHGDVTSPKELVVVNSTNHLLHFIVQSDQTHLIHHQTTDLFLNYKWRKLPLWFYLVEIFLFLSLVVAYTGFVENVDFSSIYQSSSSSESLCDWIKKWLVQLANSSGYQIVSICLVLVFIFFELVQMKSLGADYKLFDHQNLLEIITLPACLACLVLTDLCLSRSITRALFPLTLISVYMIFIFRLEKFCFKGFKLGIYVTVFKKVFNRSLSILVLPILAWFSFLFAFHFNYRYALYQNASACSSSTAQTTDDIEPNMFNDSFTHSFARMITMSLGDFQNDQMGLGELDNTFNINMAIYILSILILPLLIINIFLGISVDELRRMIEASHNHNVRLRCEYVLKIQDILVSLLGARSCTRLRKFVSKMVLFKMENKTNDHDEKWWRRLTHWRTYLIKLPTAGDGKEKMPSAARRKVDERRRRKELGRDEFKESVEVFMRKLVDQIENIEDRISRMHSDLDQNRRDVLKLAEHIEQLRDRDDMMK